MQSSNRSTILRNRLARRRLLIGTGAAGVAAFLAACGGDSSEKLSGAGSGAAPAQATTAQGAAGQAAGTQAPAVQGKFGGTLKIGYSGASLTNLDPHTGASGAEHQMFFPVTVSYTHLTLPTICSV